MVDRTVVLAHMWRVMFVFHAQVDVCHVCQVQLVFNVMYTSPIIIVHINVMSTVVMVIDSICNVMMGIIRMEMDAREIVK
jgi:hypothetical protein